MTKFKIECDPNARPFCSTRIIVDNVNTAAKKLGFYSEKDDIVFYDTLCVSHGYRKIDAFWCAFELPFPSIIQNNASGRPILGLSKQNALFAVKGGYPRNLVNYVTLGVDSHLWKPTKKLYNKDKFVFIAFSESNNRCGFEDLIPAFGEAFRNRKDVLLYIKDREATQKFKEWVKKQAEIYQVEIIHDDRHLMDHSEEIRLIQGADVGVCVNHSHTFGMVMAQAMSCGLPQIIMPYSGPADYADVLNSLTPEFTLENVSQDDIDGLSELGMKNHLFPINKTNYPRQVFWAKVNKDSLKEKMLLASENRQILSDISEVAILTARWMTWERCAINMNYVLSHLNSQKENLDLIFVKNRYE